MPQPQFRQRVTAQFERLPAPIPGLWQRVDLLHLGFESRLDRMELAHNKFWGGEAPLVQRVFGWLRVAHWYV